MSGVKEVISILLQGLFSKEPAEIEGLRLELKEINAMVKEFQENLEIISKENLELRVENMGLRKIVGDFEDFNDGNKAEVSRSIQDGFFGGRKERSWFGKKDDGARNRAQIIQKSSFEGIKNSRYYGKNNEAIEEIRRNTINFERSTKKKSEEVIKKKCNLQGNMRKKSGKIEGNRNKQIFCIEKLLEVERMSKRKELERELERNRRYQTRIKQLCEENLELKRLLWDFQEAVVKLEAKERELMIISGINE